MPSVLKIGHFAKILIKERIDPQNIPWPLRLWVGRRKEPILSYVTKKNPDRNGLSAFTKQKDQNILNKPKPILTKLNIYIYK